MTHTRLPGELIKQVQQLKAGEITPASVSYFMSTTRQVIEWLSGGHMSAGRAHFPTILFFTDWMVHPVLDRSSVSQLFNDIENAISADAGPDFSVILGTLRLRDELSICLRQISGNSFVDDDETYVRFGRTLFDHFVGKLLARTEQQLQEKLQTNKLAGVDFAVSRVYVQHNKDTTATRRFELLIDLHSLSATRRPHLTVHTPLMIAVDGRRKIIA